MLEIHRAEHVKRNRLGDGAVERGMPDGLLSAHSGMDRDLARLTALSGGATGSASASVTGQSTTNAIGRTYGGDGSDLQLSSQVVDRTRRYTPRSALRLTLLPGDRDLIGTN